MRTRFQGTTVAWFTVVLIWSTTPLAIQWSSQGAGFLFSLLVRMWIAAVLFAAILAWKRRFDAFHGRGLLAALISGTGIFSNMMLVYWAAQHIPSGLIAVIFGMSPLMTTLFASLLLENESISIPGLTGVLFGIGGLWLIFGGGDVFSEVAILAIAATILAMSIQCLLLVSIKRIGSHLSSLTLTGGGVIMTALLLLPVWLLLGMPMEQQIAERAVYAIVYLGLMGSIVGFMLYYYLLKRISAIRLSLVTLITPVTGLLMGQWFNHEQLPKMVWYGVSLVLFGLLLYQLGEWRRSSALRRATA